MKVNDLLLGQVRAFYVRMMDSSLTLARRSAYATKVLLGPTEVTGHGTAAGTRTLMNAVNDGDLSSLTDGQMIEFITWDSVNSEYDRRSLAASVTAAATDFTSVTEPTWADVNLRDSDWANNIPDYST